MALLIAYLVLSIFFSFLCSILEAVLLSITPSFLNMKVSENVAYASTLKKLKDDIDQPLIAILTLNTIAHTVGAIGVGAQAETVFNDAPAIMGIPTIGMVSGVMTLLILVASEIIPKTIGANYWKSLAGFSTRTLDIMVKVMKYTGLMFILRLLTKLVGAPEGHGKSVFSKTEFVAMVEEGTKAGQINQTESKIIGNLMKFNTILVEDVMTPRTVVVSADESMSIQDFYDENPNLRFSRIPIYQDGDIDKITGYVMKDEVLETIINQKGSEPLLSIRRNITTVDDETPIPQMFEEFMKNREHIAQVTKNEFGGFEGIVTQEDIIETLLGLEIVDETDDIDDMRKLARKQSKQRAKQLGLSIEE